MRIWAAIGKLTACGVILALSLGMFTGCAKKGKDTELVKVDENFSGKAVITVDGTEYSADIQRGGADMWQWEFSAPQTVEGMAISCSGNSARLEFMGLSYETDRDNIPESSAVTLTSAAIDKLISQKGCTAVVNDKGVTTVSGQVKGQDFYAKFKGDKLQSLDISTEVSVKFK